MILKIETNRRWTELTRRPYANISIESNGTTIESGELTEYQRKLLQFILDNDAHVKECAAHLLEEENGND